MGFGVQGLGVRVWGLGFSHQRVPCRVRDTRVGHREVAVGLVLGEGFRVESTSMVQGVAFRVQGISMVQGVGFRV